MHPPDSEMQRRAPAKDAPDSISSKPQRNQNTEFQQIPQPETVSAALLAALSHKARAR